MISFLRSILVPTSKVELIQIEYQNFKMEEIISEQTYLILVAEGMRCSKIAIAIGDSTSSSGRVRRHFMMM